MAKSSIELTGLKSWESLEKKLKEPITKEDGDEMGELFVSQMRDLISKGISPIRGVGRFPGYKNPVKYPGKRKDARPVNLYLSGQMMSALGFKTKKTRDGLEVTISYQDSEAETKERGHRDGAKGQPKRPTIPLGSEQIAVTIERSIVNLFKQILSKIK